MFCTKCGESIEEGATFCANCGEPIGGTPPATVVTHVLASRQDRFFAKLIDVARYVGAITVASIVIAFSAPLGVVLLVSVAVGIPIVQVVLLSRDGQTIGKRFLDIRIVSFETGQNAGFGANVVMRAWVNFLLNVIPFYGLADVLFIFRDDQRTIHDLIAGTHVVE
jgi:uncharacterized RDD family membrane protein YckC